MRGPTNRCTSLALCLGLGCPALKDQRPYIGSPYPWKTGTDRGMGARLAHHLKQIHSLARGHTLGLPTAYIPRLTRAELIRFRFGTTGYRGAARQLATAVGRRQGFADPRQSPESLLVLGCLSCEHGAHQACADPSPRRSALHLEPHFYRSSHRLAFESRFTARSSAARNTWLLR